MSEWGRIETYNNAGNTKPKYVFQNGLTANSSNTYITNTVLVTNARRTTNVNTAIITNNTVSRFAHIGWNEITVGTGGRAGRVSAECLVALSTPVANTANSGGNFFIGV